MKMIPIGEYTRKYGVSLSTAHDRRKRGLVRSMRRPEGVRAGDTIDGHRWGRSLWAVSDAEPSRVGGKIADTPEALMAVGWNSLVVTGEKQKDPDLAAREQRIVAHEARIEAMGLAGNGRGWDDAD